MTLHYEDAGLRLWHGSNKDILPTFADNTFDSVVTDPPYELGFMGKGWDSSGIAYDVEMWREVYRVLKPGGHLLSFGGSRTWHRIAVAIEDAGFEVRDSIAWLYGSGFPKSLDVSKAIDASQGAEREVTGRTTRRVTPRAMEPGGRKGRREIDPGVLRDEPATDDARRWQGWGTALKPAFEPIIVARKPLAGTVAANVLAHGTGALNIDASRVAFTSDADKESAKPGGVATARSGALAGKAQTWGSATTSATGPSTTASTTDTSASPSTESADTATGTGRTEFTPNQSELGRWPTNVVLDESQAAELDRQSGTLTSGRMAPVKDGAKRQGAAYGVFNARTATGTYGDSGGASRFFPTFRYEGKAPGTERPEVDGVQHATVKPLDLMRWLVRLVTRPNGRVLDLFAGSGTTGEAALMEGMEVDLIELEADHLPLILARVRKPLQVSMFGDWDVA